MDFLDKLIPLLPLALIGGGGYWFWRRWREKEEARIRFEQQRAEEEREQRKRRLALKRQEEERKKQEEKLRQAAAEAKAQERARAEAERKAREEELAKRQEEMRRYEMEEQRQREEKERQHRRRIDIFIENYVAPLLHNPQGDDALMLRRRLFYDGTLQYRKNSFFDDLAFQQRVAAFASEHGLEYRAPRDTTDYFSLYAPLVEDFERQRLELAAIEYFYAKQSGQIRYGNLRGDRNLGVDIILSDDTHAYLVSCLPDLSETIDVKTMIERFQKLEAYREDFLPQVYPELSEHRTGMILVLGASGIESLTPEAYRFAKENFERILTLENIVDFLDYNQSAKRAHEKYLAPTLPGPAS